MKNGIDVSKWQGVIDWDQVKGGGIDFAMIRLGYGSPFGDSCKLDDCFTANVTAALDAGIDVGVYFYSYAQSAAAAALEACFVLEALAPYKGRILYPVAYDLEDPKQDGLGKQTLTDMVAAFCGTVEAAGWYAMFYSNLNWCRNKLDMEALKRFDLWLAQWAATPSDAFTFGIWQRSNTGSVPGIKGGVDLDVAYKDYPAIIRAAGLNGCKAPEPATATPTVAVQPGRITTAQQLVAQAVNIARNFNTLYVMGCFGAPLTGKNVDRYCTNHDYNKQAARTAMIKAAANKNPPTYGFDCVCLIKGILWGWSGDPDKTYGGAIYASNGVPDIGADGMIKVCRDVSTDFSRIVPGAAVWVPGHIGIYIGDGLVVESTPAWGNKVQITACDASRTGYPRRNWDKWGKLPYITYQDDAAPAETPQEAPAVQTPTVQQPAPDPAPTLDEETRQLIRKTVQEIMDEMNPVIPDLKDVPPYWQEAAKAMLDTGAVNGGTPASVCATDLNLRRETFKAAVIAAAYHDAKAAAEAAKKDTENTPENDPEKV